MTFQSYEGICAFRLKLSIVKVGTDGCDSRHGIILQVCSFNMGIFVTGASMCIAKFWRRCGCLPLFSLFLTTAPASDNFIQIDLLLRSDSFYSFFQRSNIIIITMKSYTLLLALLFCITSSLAGESDVQLEESTRRTSSSCELAIARK